MASAIMGFSAKWLTDLYDTLLKDKRLSPELKDTLRNHRSMIEKIYQKIEGEWWKTGSFWQKFYRLENYFGKSKYEIDRDLEAVALVIADLDLVIAEVKQHD